MKRQGPLASALMEPWANIPIQLPKCRDCRTADALCCGPDFMDRCPRCHDKERRRAVFCGEDPAAWWGKASTAPDRVIAENDLIGDAPTPANGSIIEFVALTNSGRIAHPAFKWRVGKLLGVSETDGKLCIEDASGASHLVSGSHLYPVSLKDVRYHVRLVEISGLVRPRFGARLWLV